MRVLSSGSKGLTFDLKQLFVLLCYNFIIAPPYTLLSLPFRPPSPVLSDPAITVYHYAPPLLLFPKTIRQLVWLFLLSPALHFPLVRYLSPSRSPFSLAQHPLPPLLPCPLDSDRCLLVQPPPPLILYFGRNPHCGFKWACESRVRIISLVQNQLLSFSFDRI